MSNYATKKELKHATCVDTSKLAAKRDFIALKAEVDKLDMNKLVNVSTGLNNLKTKENDIDVHKLKPVPTDLKKLSDVVNKENVKNTKFITMKMKVYKLDEEIPKATILVQINQYGTDKQSQRKKNGNVDKKAPNVSDLVIPTVPITKLKKLRTKY